MALIVGSFLFDAIRLCKSSHKINIKKTENVSKKSYLSLSRLLLPCSTFDIMCDWSKKPFNFGVFENATWNWNKYYLWFLFFIACGFGQWNAMKNHSSHKKSGDSHVRLHYNIAYTKSNKNINKNKIKRNTYLRINFIFTALTYAACTFGCVCEWCGVFIFILFCIYIFGFWFQYPEAMSLVAHLLSLLSDCRNVECVVITFSKLVLNWSLLAVQFRFSQMAHE